jgi:DNA-binding response OmpR family regulator
MSESKARTKIAVIHRNSPDRDVILEALERGGFEAFTTEDGLEGLRLISEERPSLIILEPKLPGFTGIALLDSLRAKGVSIPVLAVTSRTKVVDHLAHQYVAGVLMKPVEADTLLRHIDAILTLGHTSDGMEKSVEQIWLEEDRSLDEATLSQLESSSDSAEAVGAPQSDDDLEATEPEIGGPRPQAEISTEISLSQHKPIALVIEGRPEMANAIAENMRSEGFEAFTAGDGQEGLSLTQKLKPNLIILDTALPLIDGYQVLQLIKFDAKFRKTPVLIAVPKDEAVDEDMARIAGADGFIHRPFGPEAIMNELRRVFQEREHATKEAEEEG